MSDKKPLIPTNYPPPPAYSSTPSAPLPVYQYASPSAPPPPPPGNQYSTTTNLAMVSTQPVRTYPVQGPSPRSYLVLAIISLIFGFWPFGLVAVVYSIKAMKACSAGYHELGFYYAKRARNFSIFAIMSGVGICFITVFLTVFLVVSDA